MKVKGLILQSIKPVVEKSKHVRINQDRMAKLADKLKERPIPPWDNELQYLGTEENTVQYYFFLDSINFCFWAKRGEKRWSYQKNGEWLKGYYAFSFAIKRAIEENPRLLDANYLSEISFDNFSEIFSGKGKLLLLKERYKIIKENFGILAERFKGKASVLVGKAKNDVNRLVRLLLAFFPNFMDVSNYQGKKVYFLKRAQIFANDLYYSLENKSLGCFKNLEDLTIFADYKIPQLLEAERVLEYSQDLLAKIKNEELIDAGSEEEVEIRANAIHACELLVEQIEKLGRKINSNQLDWLLWVLAKKTKFTLPHHKTLTTFY